MLLEQHAGQQAKRCALQRTSVVLCRGLPGHAAGTLSTARMHSVTLIYRGRFVQLLGVTSGSALAMPNPSQDQQTARERHFPQNVPVCAST
jgi:hypothetical protein